MNIEVHQSAGNVAFKLGRFGGGGVCRITRHKTVSQVKLNLHQARRNRFKNS